LIKRGGYLGIAWGDYRRAFESIRASREGKEALSLSTKEKNL